MTKKIATFFATSILATAVVLTVAFMGNNEKFTNTKATDTYTLTFDNKTRVPTLDAAPTNNEYIANTPLGNPLTFAYSNASESNDGFINLNTKGSFYNPYKADMKDLNAITGIKNITINFSGEGKLKLEYDWANIGDDSSKYSYSGVISSIRNSFNFTDNFPYYFKISNLEDKACEILSMTVEYTCKKVEIPDFNSNLTFTLNEDKISYSLVDVGNNAVNVVIPKYYNGLPVTKLNYKSFSTLKTLKTVVIPESITELLDLTFYNCTSLNRVYIPTSVTKIGERAFLSNQSLTIFTEFASRPEGWIQQFDNFSIPVIWNYLGVNETTPNGLRYSLYKDGEEISAIINDYNNLSSDVVIPDNVELNNHSYPIRKINSLTFYKNSNIQTVTISDNVKQIFKYAFYKCKSLASIELPSQLTTIEEFTFAYCSALSTFSFPNTVNYIGANAFRHCDLLTSLTLPNGLMTIKDEAFNSCLSLTAINIPITVTEIGTHAFNNCKKLKIFADHESAPATWNVEWNNDNRPVIWGYLHKNIITNDGIEYALSLLNGVNVATIVGHNRTTRVVDIPNTIETNGTSYTVTAIAGHVFENELLERVIIPKSITSIGYKAFTFNKYLTFFAEVESPIYDFGFQNGACVVWGYQGIDGITDDDLSYAISKINGQEFANIYDYSGTNNEIIIPDQINVNGKSYPVQNIVSNAFIKNTYLSSVDMPNSITNIENYAFSGCDYLRFLNMHKSNATVNVSAFSNGPYETVILTEHESRPSNWNFEENFSIVYGYQEKGITDDGFEYALSKIKTDSFINIIGYNNTAAEVDLMIPEYIDIKGVKYPVKVISDNSFKGNTSLNSVVVPDTVTAINSYAFASCKIKSIKLSNNLTFIGIGAFMSCENLTSVAIPNGVKSIEAFSFAYCSSLTSLIVPKSVLSTANYAFANSNLLKIYTEHETKPNDWNTNWEAIIWAYQGIKGVTNDGIEYAISKIDGVDSAVITDYKGTASDLIIPDHIDVNGKSYPTKKILSGAFDNKNTLTSVTIPNSVTFIDSRAFYNCSALTSVIVPNSVTTVGESAFLYCSSATIYVEFPAKPDGWDIYWNSNSSVVWDHKI